MTPSDRDFALVEALVGSHQSDIEELSKAIRALIQALEFPQQAPTALSLAKASLSRVG